MEIDEQVTPTIDTYRLRKMYASAIANSNYAYAATTSSNAYDKFLDGQEALSDAKVPVTGRVAFVSYAFYSLLKLDSTFMLASEVAMKDRITGMVGMVDGVKIVPVPSSYLAANVSYILVHPSATVAAEKFDEYYIRDNVQGFSGVVLEGRVVYDAFVIDQKVDGIWVHGTNILS
jgi:N4-gp56 family major capsid protein